MNQRRFWMPPGLVGRVGNVGMIPGGSAAAAQATADFLSFDGASTFVEWATGPSTVTDGRRGTFVVPFNRKGGSGAECILYVGTTTGESVFIGFNATDNLVCRISDGAASPTAILTLTSTTTYADSVNRVAIFSYDLDTIGGDAFYWLYVNDTDETGTPATGVAADIDLTDTWRIGSTDDATSAATRQWYSGATGHILFYPEVFPLPDANTRKYFYDAALDGPVDHGSDGSAALGDQPPLYWATTASAATANKGDGGAASSASSFSDAADPPNLASLPAYVANALNLDGLTYIEHTSGQPADGPRLLFHVAFKRSTTGTAHSLFNVGSSTSLRWFIRATDAIAFWIRSGPGVTLWDFDLSGVSADTSWNTLTVSLDASTFGTTDKLSIRYNGASVSPDTSSTTSGNLDYSLANWGDFIREFGTPDFPFIGDVAEFLIAEPSSYIDLSDSGVAANFYAGGKPVFQGLTGIKAIGVQPYVYLRGPAAQANLNNGSVAHGTITGTVTNASTSPTD